jgi:WD40 repeat protein/transcriptional regulator with XRE-family HTH domain
LGILAIRLAEDCSALVVERVVTVPSFDDATDEGIRGLVLQLRGRTGLTQRELAALAGVSVSSLQGWEAGDNYPGVASLKALIAAGLQAGGFTTGRETEEAQELWAAALRDAPRFRAPFDGAWFSRIAPGRLQPIQDEIIGDEMATTASRIPARGRGRASWGDAPDVVGFVGRMDERERLSRWISDARSRVVAILGLGGIGKTLLTTRVARDLAPAFDCVFWRSLRNAPAPDEWLAEAIGFLAPNDPSPLEAESGQVRRLLELLRDARCLLILDNFETVLQPGGSAGEYRPGYERYGTLLLRVAEAAHQSCLVMTSREEPLELGPLRGEQGPVRSVVLAGLPVEDGRALLNDKRLDGDDASWQALVAHCGGNGLALKVVGEATREVFAGSIADFLSYATASPGLMVGGVRELLGAQMLRLSPLEREVLRRLAVAREPVGIAELAADLAPDIGRVLMLEAIEGLRRRSLLERSERGPLFGLHPVVLEYVTEQLVGDIAGELAAGKPDLLLRKPLLKATAKEYVRRSQERLIAAPILERLVQACGSVRAAEQQLLDALGQQRGRSTNEQGYGPGNLVNLLRLLRGNLKGIDLSGLAIRQVYLQEIEAQDGSLVGAHLSEAVLGEAFSYPTSLALSADGEYLAAGAASGEVYLWRIADRRLLLTLPAHTANAVAVAMSGDGSLVAGGSFDGTVCLWKAEGGVLLVTLHGHTGRILAVALSGDGRLLASASFDGTVRLWQVQTGRLLATLDGHAGGVWGVSLSGDGRLVVSGGADGAVRVWESSGGRLVAALHGHIGAVWGVASSADGRIVASGGADGAVRVWEPGAGACRCILEEHAGGVRGVALSGDGRLIASGGYDGTVRLWDADTGRPSSALHEHASGVRSVALSGDGRLVASGGFDGIVRLRETEDRRPLVALHGYAGGVRGVALSGDGRLVASGAYDGTVRLWDADTGRQLAALPGHAGGVRGIALSGDGRLVVSGGFDGLVRLWAAEAGLPIATLHGHAGGVWAVALSGDGRLVVSGGSDGIIRLWEAEGGRTLALLSGHDGGIWGVALSRRGRLVASGGYDGTVRLWEVDGSRPLATLYGHRGRVLAVALSGDGHLVASGGVDGTVRLWHGPDGRPQVTLRGHDRGVWAVALSANGRMVASGSGDGTVRLWETESGSLLTTLHGHTGEVFSVSLSEDGRLAASGGDDGTVRLWETSTGACLIVLRDDRRYERLDITGLTGVTEAQRGTLVALGAVERRAATPPSL